MSHCSPQSGRRADSATEEAELLDRRELRYEAPPQNRGGTVGQPGHFQPTPLHRATTPQPALLAGPTAPSVLQQGNSSEASQQVEQNIRVQRIIARW